MNFALIKNFHANNLHEAKSISSTLLKNELIIVQCCENLFANTEVSRNCGEVATSQTMQPFILDKLVVGVHCLTSRSATTLSTYPIQTTACNDLVHISNSNHDLQRTYLVHISNSNGLKLIGFLLQHSFFNYDVKILMMMQKARWFLTRIN